MEEFEVAAGAIDGKTTGMIDAISATTLQGSLADISGLFARTTGGADIFAFGNDVDISISDTGTLSATDANLAAVNNETDGNISLANIDTLTGTLAEIKALTDAKGTGGNQFDLKADVDILASDGTASASVIHAIDTQNGNGTIKTSHGGGNGSWTITGVNAQTINATASQDTFVFDSGDGGVTINGFDQAVDKLDFSGELGGSIHPTAVIYGDNVHDRYFVKHTGSATLDVSGVSALFVTELLNP